METTTTYRRLNCIYRHLHTPQHHNHLLHLNSSSGSDDELGFGVPVVIGGMVLDIHAKPSANALPKTTTPGKVHYVSGGVARNIAECMSKLGTKPLMISIIGIDMAGNLLMEYWKSAGLDTKGIEQRQDIGTPVVCNLFDGKGEVTAGVASVEAIEKFLTQEWIYKFSANIRCAPVVMIDANLDPHSLEASCKIAAESGIFVWFEPVSVTKSRRVASIASYVTFTSPNDDELIAMANALSCEDKFYPIPSSAKQSKESLLGMLKPALLMLLANGVKIIVLTLGENGVFVCSSNGPGFIKNHLKNVKPSCTGRQLYEMVTLNCPSDKFVGDDQFGSRNPQLYVVHFPSVPTSVVRLTGAGDCLVGGTLASVCAGLDVMQSVAVGIAAAAAAVEVETNVPSSYSLATIAENARLVYSLARVICNEPLLQDKEMA